MQRLIYVSESKIKTSVVDLVISQIVDVAQKRNADLNITGALIFTGTHFAQVLEGGQDAVAELMVSLQRDPRHDAITIIDVSPITKRGFPDWKMAYQGPSKFVSRHVKQLLHSQSEPEQLRAIAWLVELAHEFSISQAPSLPNKTVSTRL